MRNAFLYLLIFISCIGHLQAQTTACFSAQVQKGCPPFTVKLKDCSGATKVFYNYGENSSYIAYDSIHTYTKPGKYTVSQKVDNGLSTDKLTLVDYIEVVAPGHDIGFNLKVCSGLQITLTVNDNLDSKYAYNFGGAIGGLTAPFTPVTYIFADANPKIIQVGAFNLSACVPFKDTTIIPIATVIKPDFKKLEVINQSTNGSIALTFNAVAGQRYFIQQNTNNNTTYSTIDTLTNVSGSITVTYSNLNTQANQYCFKILAYDDCNPPVPSEEICSLINSPVAANNQNNISWTPHIAANVINYEILKNGSILSTTTSTTSTDIAVNCGGNYCYVINGNLTGGIQTVSASQCVTAISTNIPPVITNFNSTINGSSAILTWDLPLAGVKKYSISRAQNSGAFSTLASTDNGQYSDNNLKIPENTYCYQINYTDICNNNAPFSTSTCPVILNVAIDANNNTQNNLSWTAYAGSWSPTGYTLEKLDNSNNVISSINTGISFAQIDVISLATAQLVRYRIKATGGSGEVSYSNIVEINYEGAVFAPNVFTPNGDGNNDTFFAKGKFIKSSNMTIFNRWGEVVYMTNDLNEGWNGFYQGFEAQPGAYAYFIEATDLWGKNITMRGSVTLLR